MSDTYKHDLAQRQRQGGEMVPDFDGSRYGNKRKAIAELKVKDRRRRNRKARRELQDFDEPFSASRKHVMG